jgi:bifunctional non-homologous end joining protein LigD
MSLREYNRKRDFRKTPEPAGGKARSTPGRQFVIQKHAASRLHYDFRLELDGTLKSWAVPKGPSLDPSVKSLAVLVEDHPLEYGGFEGVIPKGEYGGGTVMVWDRGTWTPEGDASQAFKRGKLKFQIHGEKLHGGWTLVRMSGRAGEDGKNWLLMKHRDREARPDAKTDILTRKQRSVISNRTMEQIAADADRVWSSRNGAAAGQNAKPGASAARSRNKPSSRSRARTLTPRRTATGGKRSIGSLAKFAGSLTDARRATQPATFKPQLATLAIKVPDGDRWLHELKFDGYRILTFIEGGKVRLVTRQGKDWTARFRSVADAFAQLPVKRAILDGEMVALDDEGISDFQRLQNSLKRGDDAALVFYLFDVPHFEGWDLTATPLIERKELLSRLLAHQAESDPRLRYSDHIRGQGEQILQHACQGALEGIVSKLADAGYRQARSTAWLKVKCLKRQEFVIGGFTRPSGSRVGFGALLLGYYDGDELIYCGRVGTGFTHASLRQLKVELNKRKSSEPPFKNPPTGSNRRGVTWVRPELVGEVEFTEWTDDGLLRHPSFHGLREDNSPRRVVREEPRMPRTTNHQARDRRSQNKSAGASPAKSIHGNARDGDAAVAGVRISHPNRVIYPDKKLTKLHLAQFYEQIAEWILPHIAGRPLTLVRCPAGSQGECFYQKHLTGSLPDEIHGVMIREKNKSEEYPVIDNVAGLVSLVQMGVLEIHPWPAREDDVERPDRLVFDLDPGEGVAWKAVVQGAKDVRDFLDELGLTSFLRTSGGKGLHVVVPLSRRNTWEELKAFAKGFADEMVASSPSKYIATMSKAKRRGKVYIDYLRNQRGATAIASYSTRARPGAPVATPLAWDELSVRTKSDAFNVTNLSKRLADLRADPWKDFFTIRQSLTRKLLRSLSATSE